MSGGGALICGGSSCTVEEFEFPAGINHKLLFKTNTMINTVCGTSMPAENCTGCGNIEVVIMNYKMNLILWHCTARGCHLHKGYDNVEPWNVKGANEYFVINSFLYMFIFVHSQNLIHQKEWIDLLWSLMASQRSNQSCQKSEDGRGPIRKRLPQE